LRPIGKRGGGENEKKGEKNFFGCGLAGKIVETQFHEEREKGGKRKGKRETDDDEGLADILSLSQSRAEEEKGPQEEKDMVRLLL